jgi:signal peptidase I
MTVTPTSLDSPTEARALPVEPVRPRPRLSLRGGFTNLLDWLALAALVFTLVNLATMRFFIDGISMNPTFADNQYVLVSRAHYLLGEPAHGDIVVFDAPGDDSSRNNPLLIKRLIGLPGDHVVVGDGTVTVNGVLLDEPYINADEPFTCSLHCDIVLEAGQYYLMGDNRNHSNDSRAFGPVTRDRIVGEALLRYWPLNQIGSVVRYGFPD